MSEYEKKKLLPIFQYLEKNDYINNAIGRELTGKSSATVRRYLGRLCQIGLLETTGVTKNKVYKKIKSI